MIVGDSNLAIWGTNHSTRWSRRWVFLKLGGLLSVSLSISKRVGLPRLHLKGKLTIIAVLPIASQISKMKRAISA